VFYSKTFSPAEQNYDIHDRELLAIIRALEAWRHYIQGSGHSTVILSDHQNLTAHKEAKKLNRRQARWFLFLSEYDIIDLIDVDLQERIANIDKMDKDAETALLLLLNGKLADDWTLEKYGDRNILFYREKNYIPRDDLLRKDILRDFHDHKTAGHPGELQTYNAVRQHYWWPGLCTFVKNYVLGCGTCQQFKID